ncbi:hypothetical protein [Leucobacter denitrificans]|uniref:DUF1795 domain-containing protein n=1 Tax=Leucobacter denitrificans TaxID=683042 RepID=A0A7G9S2J6_9MICO|nr:hypothetical protein [Leucobacter denitrificans]QNN62071.1 hypothetical protein H9L06_07075 [Leucobacter denitrificans]
MSQEEIDVLARLTTGSPPTDLLWHFSKDLPDGWTYEKFNDEGIVQATVSPRCILQFHQPMGLGDDTEPDSAQVALDYATELGQEAFNTELTVTPEAMVMLNAIINDGALYSQLGFARVSFSAESTPGLEGTTYALRQGDFALIATAVCGDGEFAKHGDQMREYIESASADITY